jgi:hypothetical protein
MEHRGGVMFRIVSLVPITVLTFAQFAKAEPVTFSFKVQINERCGPDGCDLVSGPSFPGTVTFDDGITDEFEIREGSTFGFGRRFGPPTFSTPPLDFTPIPPDAIRRPQTSNITEASWALELDGTVRYSVLITERLVHPATGSSWITSLSIGSFFFFQFPSLSPKNLIADAGPDPFISYSFISDGIRYQGQAIPEDGPAPIPEPSALLLCALGATGLLAKTRRKQHTPS